MSVTIAAIRNKAIITVTTVVDPNFLRRHGRQERVCVPFETFFLAPMKGRTVCKTLHQNGNTDSQ